MTTLKVKLVPGEYVFSSQAARRIAALSSGPLVGCGVAASACVTVNIWERPMRAEAEAAAAIARRGGQLEGPA